MEPLLYVMAIMGCGDAGGACTQVRQTPAVYGTEAACMAAQDEALLANSDVDWPVVVAECRRTGTRHIAAADTGVAGL